MQLEFSAGIVAGDTRALLQQSDLVLAEAYDEVVRLGVAPEDAATRQRCQLAVRRREALEKLHAFDPSWAPDVQDRFYLQEFDADLLDPCANTPQEHRDGYELACRRSQHFDELLAAMQSRKALAVANLLADGLLAAYPPLQDLQEQLDALLAEAELIGQMVQALESAEDDAAVRILNFNCLRNHPDLFRPHGQRIEQLVRRRLQQARLVPRVPALTLNPDRTYVRARWSWLGYDECPYSCRVGFVPDQRPEEPADVEHPLQVAAAEYFGDVLASLPACKELFVAVWPVVQLNWMEVEGRLVHLGSVVGRGRREAENGRRLRRGRWLTGLKQWVVAWLDR